MPINIVIPASGLGTRFSQAGYTEPKPFLPIANDRRMLEVVMNNLKGVDCVFHVIVRKEHAEAYNPYRLLGKVAVPHKLIMHTVTETTEGAACTVLLTERWINNNDPLIVANSDQWLDFKLPEFVEKAKEYDGYILTLQDTNPKWSFVGRDSNGKVNKVVEKQPISDEATCGVYWYKKGSDFVKSAKAMIKANDRFNKEFYFAPTYNYLLKAGGTVETMKTNGMYGLGTPEDLEAFLKSDMVDKATKF